MHGNTVHNSQKVETTQMFLETYLFLFIGTIQDGNP